MVPQPPSTLSPDDTALRTRLSLAIEDISAKILENLEEGFRKVAEGHGTTLHQRLTTRWEQPWAQELCEAMFGARGEWRDGGSTSEWFSAVCELGFDGLRTRPHCITRVHCEYCIRVMCGARGEELDVQVTERYDDLEEEALEQVFAHLASPRLMSLYEGAAALVVGTTVHLSRGICFDSDVQQTFALEGLLVFQSSESLFVGVPLIHVLGEAEGPVYRSSSDLTRAHREAAVDFDERFGDRLRAYLSQHHGASVITQSPGTYLCGMGFNYRAFLYYGYCFDPWELGVKPVEHGRYTAHEQLPRQFPGRRFHFSVYLNTDEGMAYPQERVVEGVQIGVSERRLELLDLSPDGDASTRESWSSYAEPQGFTRLVEEEEEPTKGLNGERELDYILVCHYLGD